MPLDFQNKGLKNSYQLLKKNLDQSYSKQKMLTSELNESEEINYQLRLKIQQLSQQILRRPQVDITIQQWRIEKDKKITQLEQKINKMEIMKKQYLKAYSKVKNQKEELQFKYSELQERFKERQMLGDTDELANRLKTIVQIPEQQFRQSLNRISRLSDCYPTSHVKQLLQKSLSQQSTKEQRQQYIRNALDFLNNHQIQSQDIEQIHSYYKNLLAQIEKSVRRQRKKYQHQFDELFNKLMHNRALSGEKKSPQKSIQSQLPINTTQKDSMTQTTETKKKSYDIEPFDDRFNFQIVDVGEQEQTFSIASKLKKVYDKYQRLWVKYEQLLIKNQVLSKIIKKDSQTYHEYEEQLQKSQVSLKTPKKQPNNQNQIFTQKMQILGHLLYETLCNLPGRQQNSIYFEPQSIQQIINCAKYIFKFSTNLDQEYENQRKLLKNCAFQLINVIGQVAKKTDMVVQDIIGIIKQKKFSIFHDEIFMKFSELTNKLPSKNIQIQSHNQKPTKTIIQNSTQNRQQKQIQLPKQVQNVPQNVETIYETPTKQLDQQLLAQLEILRARMGL